MAPAAANFYNDPTKDLQVVGVTGTNGKTTTAFLVRDLLEADHRQTGLLGTVKSIIGGETHEVVRTTPEAIDLQRTFRQMREQGDVAAVMEVSSHALELHRADAIHFAAGDLHEPDAGPSRLPSDDGGLLPRQAQAVRRTQPAALDHQHRRPVRRPTGAQSSETTPSRSRSMTPTRPTARRTST